MAARARLLSGFMEEPCHWIAQIAEFAKIENQDL
jgi:hypothetical protein